MVSLIKRAIQDGIIEQFIIDPFNGVEDIKNKVIRFVGDGRERVNEDRLRLIRGYRFLSQFGKGWKFWNHTEMWGLTVDVCLSKGLDVLSKERIRDEVIKIFKHNPCFALYHMPDYLISYILPIQWNDDPIEEKIKEFHGHFHGEEIKQHLMFTLATATRLTVNPLLRLACFLHDHGKCLEREYNKWEYPTFIHHDTVGADAIEKWMNEMKFSKVDIHYVTQLIRHHMVNYNLLVGDKPKRAVKRYVMRLGEELLDDMILLNYCDRTANLANIRLCSYEEYLKHYTIKPTWLEIKAKDDCFKITDLKVNGHDMIKSGLEGKEIGKMLQHLYNQVENEQLKNKRDVLLNEVIKKTEDIKKNGTKKNNDASKKSVP